MKISLYGQSPSPSLSDRLIGTHDAGGDNTYNFSIESVLALGSSMYAPNNYGSFFDLTTQSCLTGNIKAVEFSGTLASSEISIASLTKITPVNPGTYNLSLSFQAEIGTGSNDDIVLWLRVSGVDIPNSARKFEIPTTHDSFARQVVFPSVAIGSGEYVEVMWTQSGDISLPTFPADLVVPYPAIPSVILDVVRVY